MAKIPKSHITKIGEIVLSPTTAAYAILNKCWSHKYLGVCFSPEGECYTSPAGLRRGRDCWVVKTVRIKETVFTDLSHGSYDASYKAALAFLTNHSDIVLIGHRKNLVREMKDKKTKTGQRGLFIYPPDDMLPRSFNNKWVIQVQIGHYPLRYYNLSPTCNEGDKEFQDVLAKASRDCEELRLKFLKHRLFIASRQ